jgi:magnesium-transporting ATPase (P-type)
MNCRAQIVGDPCHCSGHLRPEAKRAVTFLHAIGLQTVLLTGDAKAVAESMPRRSASISWMLIKSIVRNALIGSIRAILFDVLDLLVHEGLDETLRNAFIGLCS